MGIEHPFPLMPLHKICLLKLIKMVIGCWCLILSLIIVSTAAFITTNNGGRRRKKTTRGWEILLQWKDGSTTWEAMKDIHAEYPIQFAEYALSKGIDDQPAFAWWIPYVMKKRNRIISRTIGLGRTSLESVFQKVFKRQKKLMPPIAIHCGMTPFARRCAMLE